MVNIFPFSFANTFSHRLSKCKHLAFTLDACAPIARVSHRRRLNLSFRNILHFFLISATVTDNGANQNRYRDYQLLADFATTAQLPQPCINLLANLSVHSDAADILAALILYIFHEFGFVLFDSHVNDAATQIPTYWGYTNVTQIPENYSYEAAACIRQQQPSSLTNDHTYTIYMKLLNFSEERLVLIIRKIVNGDALCVSFCFRNRSESICQPVSEFVRMSIDDGVNAIQQIQQCPTECFKNIEILVNKIKSKIITPIRNAVMVSAGLRFPSLIGMPKEILWHLMRRLDVKSLQNLSHTCTYMRNEVRIYLNENHINLASNRRPTPIIRQINRPVFNNPRPDWFRFDMI